MQKASASEKGLPYLKSSQKRTVYTKIGVKTVQLIVHFAHL